MGINTGILFNATPLSEARIKELEQQVLEQNKTFAYADENGDLCFALPFEPDLIKELAWNNAYELSTEANSFTKKAYKKTGLKTFSLDKVLSKSNINDSWSEGGEPATERLEGDGQEFYTMAPSTLSFRSTAPLNELQDVQINGQTVDPSNYELEEGSTIVKLKHDYLSTLDIGQYELSVVSDSKTVKGDFTVAAPELNEYGFYYNQPYYLDADTCEKLYIEADIFVGSKAVIIRNDWSVMIIQPGNIADGRFNFSTLSFTDGLYSIAIDSPYLHLTNITGCFSDDGQRFITSITVKNTIPMFPDPVAEGIEFYLNNDVVVLDDTYVYQQNYYNKDIYEIGSALDNTLETYSFSKNNIYDKPIRNIGFQAFADCYNLKNVMIPEHITLIDNSAFQDCMMLTEVILPDGITHIGDFAFDGCSNLLAINFNGTMQQWAAIDFGSSWSYGSSIKYIQCSDGQVAL